jgi:hypothetical protein
VAFRASSQIKAEALQEIKDGAIRAKALAIQYRDAMAAGDYSAAGILTLLSQARALIARWGVLSAVSGLAAYAQDQEGDPAYDVIAEFTAMNNALIAVRNRIINELPKSSAPAATAGMVGVFSFAADGAQVYTTFAPAQTVNLRADLDAFIATVS